MRKFIPTIIIALVFVAFLGYYYLGPKDTGVEGFESLLGEVEGKEIDKVELKDDNGDKKVIKEGEEWYVFDGEKYIADEAVIKEMIYKLERLESLEIIDENPENLEQFGLKSPVYKLTVYSGDKSQEVYVGNLTPSEDCYFAKLPEKDTVYKIGKSRLDEISKPIDELRPKQIFAGNSEDVVEIDITRQGNHLLTFTYDDGAWRIDEVTSYELDKEKVEKFIADLKNIQISEFQYDKNVDLSFYGLDNPSVIATMTYKNGDTDKLILGSSAGLGEVYGKRGESDTVFTVPYESVEFFGKITVGQ